MLRSAKNQSAASRQTRSVLVFSILLVVLANGLFAAYRRVFWKTTSSGSTHLKWSWVLRSSEKFDWVILGGSSGVYSFQPEVAAAKFGCKSVNLCSYEKIGLPPAAWMIQKYLEKRVPTSGFIIINTWNTWRTNSSNDQWPNIPMSLWSLAQLKPRPKLVIDEFGDIVLKRLLPLYQKNLVFFDLPSPQIQSRSEVRMPFGSIVSLNLSGHPPVPTRESRTKSFSLSKDSADALEAIGQLSEKYGVDVFVVNPPIMAGLFTEDEMNVFLESMERTFVRVNQQWPRIRYVRNPIVLQPDHFFDELHVVYPGAVKYTELLLASIYRSKRKMSRP